MHVKRIPDDKCPERLTGQELQAMEVAERAGHILLENGAEISRVEEVMERIASYYGVETSNFFVLSNGIFSTGGTRDLKQEYAKVEHIPVKGTQLDKVIAVCQLSRDIPGQQLSVEEASRRLDAIGRMPVKGYTIQIFASSLGAGSFSFLFGGSMADALAAAITGLLLYVYVLFVGAPHFSKIVNNIVGGAIACLGSLLCFHFGLGNHLNLIIIGAVMPLIPGVSFTNGIRDIADSDYLSGTVRLLDAMLIFLCIAIGVSLTLVICSDWVGEFLSGDHSSIAAQLLSAFLGTFAFSLLYGLPNNQCVFSGLVGALGWLVYLLLVNTAIGAVGATFFGSSAVVLASRFFAVWRRIPSMAFMIPGIFPLVPGAGIYWCTYYLVENQLTLSLEYGVMAVKCTFAIVLGIVLVFELPHKFFRILSRR